MLGELERQLAEDYYRALTDTELEVLVERESDEREGWVHGTDRRYVPVELPGSEADVGRVIAARGEFATRHYLEASRAELWDGVRSGEQLSIGQRN